MEATTGRQLLEIAENEIQSVLSLPEPDRANTGRVEHKTSAFRQQHELPRGRGVPALAVNVADRADLKAFLTDQGVDQR